MGKSFFHKLWLMVLCMRCAVVVFAADTGIIWSCDFEGAEADVALTGETNVVEGHYLMTGSYDDNDNLVKCDAESSNHYVMFDTVSGCWFSALAIGNANHDVYVVPEEGDTVVIDWKAKPTMSDYIGEFEWEIPDALKPAATDSSSGNLNDRQLLTSERGFVSTVVPLVERLPGFFMIDDKLVLGIYADEESDNPSTNWFAKVGVADMNNELVAKSAILEPMGGVLDMACFTNMNQMTVIARNDGSVHGLAFSIYINDMLMEMDGVTQFRALPSATNRVGVAALGIKGCGCIDDISFISSNLWSYTENADGTFTITGANDVTGDMTIPSKINGKDVTAIGSYAFVGCSDLTSVTIPDSVMSIGERAFTNCINLASVTIPGSVKKIGSDAFSGCVGLTTVHISDLAAWCGIYFVSAGSNPLATGSLYLNGALVSDLVIPDGVKSIAKGAFCGCSNLTSVTIPSSVTEIGDFAFLRCSGLQSFVVAPDNLMFKVESGLLLSKDGATLIAASRALTSVSIPDGVMRIGTSAFEGLGGLSEVTIPNSVTNIGERSFRWCSGLKDIMIPFSVTSIGQSAFYGCTKLTSITMPASVTNIGYSAFRGCNKLTRLTIPGSVSNICQSTFQSSGLANVIIPDSVTNIEESAFLGCKYLTNVVFTGNAPKVGRNAFSGLQECVASVSPKSTGWGVNVGEKWNGLTLKYWPEMLTAAASDAEVGEKMLTFADESIVGAVTSVAEYEAFRAWVDDKNLYQPSVVASPHTAAAYLLGAERLFENEPTVEIGELVIGDGESAGTMAMTVAVTVKDGEIAVAVSAAKVSAMFEATGDLGDWTGAAKLTPTVTTSGTDESGKMTFVVTPGDGTAVKAFLRIRR